MKKALSLLICYILLVSFSAFSQKINYESSLEDAKAASLKQGKPLAILITITPPVATPDFQKGLNDPAVIEKFNSNFVNFRADVKDSAIVAPLSREHHVHRLPALVFFDAKGGILFNDLAILSRPEALLTSADKAVLMSKEKSIVDYESEYKSGKADRDFLRSYIVKRQNTGRTDNAELIEKYASLLSVQDLNNYAEVLFILKAGPILDSTAYKLAFVHRKIVDSIYRTEPLPVRSALNNAIIGNTMQSAIANKNMSRAYAIANFTRSTWSNDYRQGEKNYNLKLLQYHAGVKDTMSYLRTASTYYERYYMLISTDSARRMDSINFEQTRMRAVANQRFSTTQPGNFQRDTTAIVRSVERTNSILRDTVRRTVSFSFPKDMYATELNNAAWSFYQMAGNNNEFLMKAMFWSRRSLELAEKAAFYDTYAHLLYKLKFYSEAESMQKKAVSAAKTEKIDTKVYESEYGKIKNRTL